MIEFLLFLLMEYTYISFEQRILQLELVRSKKEACTQITEDKQHTADSVPEYSAVSIEGATIFENSKLNQDAYDLLHELGYAEELGEENDGNDEDTLSISDINPQTMSSPTSKIGDLMIGQQIWRVRVVGIESHYIHVYDGARTWLSVDDVSSFEHDDLVELVVDRIDEDDVRVVQVKDIYRVSHDFLIPDESDSMVI